MWWSTAEQTSSSEGGIGFQGLCILGQEGGQGEPVSLREIETAKRQIVAILDANHGRFDGIHHKFVVRIHHRDDHGPGLCPGDHFPGGGRYASAPARSATRKALGAQPAAILNPFMVEAVLVCGGGGLAGIGLAAGLI